MVFRYKTSKNVMFEEDKEEMHDQRSRGLSVPTQEATNKMVLWKEHRDSILKSLQNCGLKLFCFYSRDRDEVFCKVGASAEKLKDTAARMKYSLQLKQEYLGAHAEYRHDFPGRPELQFADRRIVSHAYKVHTEDEFHSEDAIFSTRDKICLICHIINAKDKDCAGLSLGNILHEQSELKSCFPLHEQAALQDLASRITAWVMMPKEHANRVRDYFGEKIAFYFLFLSFYWRWLMIPAFVGVVLQIVDVLMKTPDNFSATPFCIVSASCALLLPHFWRREEAKYALAWGTFDMDMEFDKPRPEHWGEPRINPVTGQVEPFYPEDQRFCKHVFSIFVMLGCAVGLASTILGMLYARHQLKTQVMGGIVTFQFLLAILVETINVFLTIVSKWLTDRENHRTQGEYDLHLLSKSLGFKFVNSYFVLYYIAFMKDHSRLFGEPMRCIRDDCFLDLQSQLAVFTVVRLTVKNFARFAFPRLRTWYRHISVHGQHCMANMHRGHDRLELADLSNAEIQSKLDSYDAFTDFDETLITHGYASFFAVSSPWVCAATLLWVVCELLLDMKGLTETRRRPMPTRVRGTGAWTSAFEVYGVVAAFTNVTLLVFASDQYAGWKLSYKVVLFMYIGHIILFAYLGIKALFPEIPRSVVLMAMKQEVIVQRCLENIKMEHHQQDLSQLRRRDGTDRPLEVLEHDPTDNEGMEAEPELSFMGAWRALNDGLADHVHYRVVLTIAVCLVICLVSATTVFIFYSP